MKKKEYTKPKLETHGNIKNITKDDPKGGQYDDGFTGVS